MCIYTMYVYVCICTIINLGAPGEPWITQGEATVSQKIPDMKPRTVVLGFVVAVGRRCIRHNMYYASATLYGSGSSLFRYILFLNRCWRRVLKKPFQYRLFLIFIENVSKWAPRGRGEKVQKIGLFLTGAPFGPQGLPG